jgi:hypothetical protein
MFDELCRTGRVHELATIHRFRHRWEQAASLQLRAGRPEALDAYFRHGRVGAGTFDALSADIARQWIDHRAAGRSVAVVAETNGHVDALNRAIHELRRDHGQLGDRAVSIAGGEAAAVGDVVVTRRNNRELRTSHGEPVRNRDRWTVTAVGRDGSLAVSHEHGHGQVSLPADYAREHVRLGYAATAHGHQGDTVDVSLTVVTAATTHRSLYVGATRGRDLNRLLVVADEPDLVRDVLEEVLTNERADIPAVAQRRHLASQEPRLARETAEERLAAARLGRDEAAERAAPHLRPLRKAEDDLEKAKRDLRVARRAAEEAPLWRRRTLTKAAPEIEAGIAPLQARVAELQRSAAPYVRQLGQADERVRDAEREASIARTQQRLDELARRPPARTRERDLGMGIEL